jgi:hypothetical protein
METVELASNVEAPEKSRHGPRKVKGRHTFHLGIDDLSGKKTSCGSA